VGRERRGRSGGGFEGGFGRCTVCYTYQRVLPRLLSTVWMCQFLEFAH